MTRELTASPGGRSAAHSIVATTFWALLVVLVGVVSLKVVASDAFAGRQGIRIVFLTESAGPSMIFWSDTGEWSRSQSLTIPVRAGINDVFYPVPSNRGSTVRWDPGEAPGTYEVLSVAVVRDGVALDLGLHLLDSPAHRLDRQSIVDGVVEASDQDPQVLIPLAAPIDGRPSAWKVVVAAFAVIGALGLVAVGWAKRRIGAYAIAVGFIVWLYGLFFLYVWKTAPRFPYWDDWRYLRDVTDTGRLPTDAGWLFEPVNDTVWATGRLLDATILNVTNFSFFALQVFGVVLLGVFLGVLIVLVRRVARGAAPGVAPYATLLVGYALMAQSYWLQPAIAYHQFLPLLFGAAILLLLGVEGRVWPRTLAISGLAVAAGLAYISGAVMLLVMGTTYLMVFRPRAGWPATVRRHAPGFAVLAVGVVSMATQLALVQRAQGSFLEGTSAAPTVFPWESSFWAFYLGLSGRSVGLESAPLPVLVAVAGALTVAPLVVWFGLSPRRSSARAIGDYERHVLLFGAAMIPTYFAAVTAGRAGLAPSQLFSAVRDYGAARFHFFWASALLALVWLGWYVVARLAPSGRRRIAGALLVAVTALLVVPKSAAPWIYSEGFEARRIAFVRTEACISSHVAAGELDVVLCEHASSGDIGPVLRLAYRFDMAFIRQAHLPPSG